MYKPLESILDNFYENRFLLIEALYVVNLPSVPWPPYPVVSPKSMTMYMHKLQCLRLWPIRDRPNKGFWDWDKSADLENTDKPKK